MYNVHNKQLTMNVELRLYLYISLDTWRVISEMFYSASLSETVTLIHYWVSYSQYATVFLVVTKRLVTFEYIGAI